MDLEKFFATFREALNALDREKILEFCHFPLTICVDETLHEYLTPASLDLTTVQVFFAQELGEDKRVQVVIEDVKELTDDAHFVEIDWCVQDDDDAEARLPNRSFLLLRDEATWKIGLIYFPFIPSNTPQT